MRRAGAAARAQLHILGVVLLHPQADQGLAAGPVEGPVGATFNILTSSCCLFNAWFYF